MRVEAGIRDMKSPAVYSSSHQEIVEEVDEERQDFEIKHSITEQLNIIEENQAE